MPSISTLRLVERCLACEAGSVGAVEAVSVPRSLRFGAMGVSPRTPSGCRSSGRFWSLRFAMFRFSDLRRYSVGLVVHGVGDPFGLASEAALHGSRTFRPQ